MINDSTAPKRARIDSFLDSEANDALYNAYEDSPDRPDSPLASIASAASAMLLETSPPERSSIPTPQSPTQSEALGAALLAEFSGKVEANTATLPIRPVSPLLPTPPLLSQSVLQLQAQLKQAALQQASQAQQQQPLQAYVQKSRLQGPIRAAVNIRHGLWAPKLRCRKRKNLHAKSTIMIPFSCTIDQLIAAVKCVLPDDFFWNEEASPLRFQAVNDQSLQSLKPVTPEMLVPGQSLFSVFDVVRNRRSDGENFILQLYVYGTWMALLKHPDAPLPQLQRLLPVTEESKDTQEALGKQQTVTQDLECVTLEMKVKGSFVPVQFSKRSFLAAIQSAHIQESTSTSVTEDLVDSEEDDDEEEDEE